MSLPEDVERLECKSAALIIEVISAGVGAALNSHFLRK